jgi:ABC-type phosphate transport system permease subunit
MIRFLFRFLGLVCLALGFIFLVYDGTKSIADQRLYITTVSDVWAAVHESSLGQLRPMIQRLAVWIDPVVQSVLNAPTWLVLAVLGTFLILLGRKKRPLIGYARD